MNQKEMALLIKDKVVWQILKQCDKLAKAFDEM